MKDFINYDDMYECIKNIYIDALDEDEVKVSMFDQAGLDINEFEEENV